MDIRFEETTRGTGMVFIRVEAVGFEEPVTLSAENTTVEGRKLPVEFYPIERFGDYVVAFPVFGLPQRIVIRAHDKDGCVVAEAQKIVNPQVAKLHSQINTAIKNPVALYIRNSNRRTRAQSTVVHVTDVIQGTHKESIIHGRVSIFSTSPAALKATVALKVLDLHAQSAALSDVTVLSDELMENEEFPGAYSRTIQYSVPVSEKCRSVVLWATSTDSSISDGVLSLEAHVMDAYRSSWHARTLSADRDGRYEEWFLEHHRSSVRDFELQRMRDFKIKPSYSIIVPLYKTPINYFHEMVDSVLNQTYGNFELILVNASPEDKRLAAAVDEVCARDSRIKVKNLAANEGITLNTNEGIKMASGDFVAFFDHDDVIEPDLLYWYTVGINDYPETDLLYCDEDKLEEDHYVAPHFKPDWNPDLLTGCNYVTHMLTVRKAILDTLELPGKEFDGAQDYNMTFRVSEKARNIYHSRRILYHWRIHPGSTAASSKAKPYTVEAGIRSLQGHLDRMGISGRAKSANLANYYRIDYELRENPLISIVIPNKDAVDLLERCIDSIVEKSTYANFEILVVENNSTDSATFAFYDKLEKSGRARVINVDTQGKFNFSKVVNEGFTSAKGDYLLMLNNDTEVISPDWLQALAGPLSREDVGAVGAKLLFPDKTIQHAGVTINRFDPIHIGESLPEDSTDYFNYLNMPQDLSAVTGACLMTTREVFDSVGGLDESYAADFNDIDFCLKVGGRGLRIVYTPFALLTHYESASRDVSESPKRRLLQAVENGRLMQAWPSYWAIGDPCLSPNFMPGSPYKQLGC